MDGRRRRLSGAIAADTAGSIMRWAHAARIIATLQPYLPGCRALRLRSLLARLRRVLAPRPANTDRHADARVRAGAMRG
eukprot:5348337-Alexandrium_andersonii.AAC.1